MITATTYRQTLTITTDDDGTRTVTRSSHASTHSAFLFQELSAEAQERAIAEAIEEERDAYYTSAWEYASHTGTDVSEIWEAYRDLVKNQPVEWHDHYTSFYLTISDPERVTPEQDTGICWSMAICGEWNRYAAAVPLLVEEAEEHESIADEITAPCYWPFCVIERETPSMTAYSKAHEAHAEKCREKAEELAEQAKDALESIIKELIDGVEDYYQSAEFWRDWLQDGETRFTRAGHRI